MRKRFIESLTKNELLKIITEVTDGYKKKSGSFETSVEDEKDFAVLDLRQHYKNVEVSDGRQCSDDEVCWVISYDTPYITEKMSLANNKEEKDRDADDDEKTVENESMVLTEEDPNFKQYKVWYQVPGQNGQMGTKTFKIENAKSESSAKDILMSEVPSAKILQVELVQQKQQPQQQSQPQPQQPSSTAQQQNSSGIQNSGGNQQNESLTKKEADSFSSAGSLIAAIKSAYDIVEAYNGIITYFKEVNKKDDASILEDIIQDEYKHIGKLQKLLTKYSDGSEGISEGEKEAAKQIKESVDDSFGDFSGFDMFF